MSSRIKDTLLNHEVAPPEGSWQQIAAALDEAANGYRFPEKLYQLEIKAPASSWDIISQQLDEAAQEGSSKTFLSFLEICGSSHRDWIFRICGLAIPAFSRKNSP